MSTSSYSKFNIPEHLTIVSGEGNLPKILISTKYATAEIYLYGAHVSSFIPSGQGDMLWMSPLSPFQEGKAIRGGIPICFPWFGPHREKSDFPAHGFVRTQEWSLDSSALLSDGQVQIVLSTKSNDQTKQLWPFDFHLELRVTTGPCLTLELITTNTDSKPFIYEDCLHTYFDVADVNKAVVTGLENTPYLDRLEKDKPGVLLSSINPDKPVTYIFPKSAPDAQIEDTTRKKVISSHKNGFKGSVAWTPFTNAEKSFPEIGTYWKNFICLEAVNCGDYAVTLLPGTSHKSAVRYSVK